MYLKALAPVAPVALVCALVLAGCGGGGSEDDTSSLTLGVLTGAAADDPGAGARLSVLKRYLTAHPQAGGRALKLTAYAGVDCAEAADRALQDDAIALLDLGGAACTRAALESQETGSTGSPGSTGSTGNEGAPPAMLLVSATTNPADLVESDAGSLPPFLTVVPPQRAQGTAAGTWAGEVLGVKRCLVLAEKGPAGAGPAFRTAARKAGVDLVPATPAAAIVDDTVLTKAKVEKVDCVYLDVSTPSTAEAVIRSKVRILGDQTRVPLLVSSTLGGSAAFAALPESEGVHVTLGAPEVSVLSATSASTALADGDAAAPSAPDLIAAQALQMLLAAVADSDGSRSSVVQAGVGPTAALDLPAATSIFGTGISVGAGGEVSGSTTSIARLIGSVLRPLGS